MAQRETLKGKVGQIGGFLDDHQDEVDLLKDIVYDRDFIKTYIHEKLLDYLKNNPEFKEEISTQLKEIIKDYVVKPDMTLG